MEIFQAVPSSKRPSSPASAIPAPHQPDPLKTKLLGSLEIEQTRTLPLLNNQKLLQLYKVLDLAG